MRFALGVLSLVMRGGAAVVTALGVVLLVDGHPLQGVGAIAAALALMIGGTALRERPAMRRGLSDALYMSGDDMIGYRSRITRRNR